MTRVDTSRLSPLHQRFIKKQAHESEQRKKPRKEKPTLFGEEFDSVLELDFACELEQWRLNRVIHEWRYHPLRFRLAPNVTHEPDFMTVTHWRDADTELTIYEVKGSWDMKNARDARTRLQIAAYSFQWFGWQAVTRKNGLWQFEVIHANQAEEPMD